MESIANALALFLVDCTNQTVAIQGQTERMSANPMLEWIEQRTGTHLRDSRLERVERLLSVLQSRMPVAALRHALQTEPLNTPLWQEIIREITVGETYFFRNKPQFDALRFQIFPALIAQRRRQNQKYLRVWSAGCATGEEPYSIAMLLRDLLPDWREWSLFILATDINQGMLDTARAGRYRSSSFRMETPPDLRQRWFEAHNGIYTLDPLIRQMVTFRPLNLVDGDYPSQATFTVGHDVVLCRNVTIYFNYEQTSSVIGRLHGALADDGWLLVGHSEPQLHVYDAFQMVRQDGTILYRKTTKTAPPSPQPMLAPQAVPAALTPLPASAPALPVETVALAGPVLPANDGRHATIPDEAAPPQQVDLLAQARHFADREDWESAQVLLEQIEHMERNNPLLHFTRALILAQTDHNAAISALQQAIYCDPKFALAHFWEGEIWSQQGARTRAESSWRRAARALHAIPDEVIIPGDYDMTAAMLRGLLNYRLGNLSNQKAAPAS